MKKVLALVLVLMLALSAAAMAEDMPVVKIGVFEPASGDSGAGGKQETLGMQYANYETPTVMIGDTEYKVELVYADNQSTQDKAPGAASELVNQQVSIVLGSYGSGVSNAGAKTFGDAGIPVIGVTCTNPSVTQDRDYYFRICFTDPDQGKILANYAYNDLGVTVAYTLAELGNDYDVGLVHYFTEAFESLGGTVYPGEFPNGTSDFTSYLTNATAVGAGVFFAPCSIAYDTQIIEQAASQNVSFPLLGSDTWDSNVVIDAAKGTNVKICLSTFYMEGGNAEFDTGIKEWINSDSTAMTNNGGNDMVAGVSAMGYDAYYVALEALKAAGSTEPADVLAALPSVTYEGASGSIVFDPETGDAVRNNAYIKVADNENGVWALDREVQF